MPGQITGRPTEPQPEEPKPETQPEPEEPQPEEPQPEDSEELVDLNEYNELREKEIARTVISEQKQSKFKCPRCGARLYYDNPDVILPSRPAKKKLICKACRNVDYVLA